jgi:delta8-fatty-acid desaturase
MRFAQTQSLSSAETSPGHDHLFPRLPHHNLRRASQLVKQLAKEQGLTYAEFGSIHGYQKIFGTLQHVAQQVKIMGKVAKAEARGAVKKRNMPADVKLRAPNAMAYN